MNNNFTTFTDDQKPVIKDLLARPLRDLRVSLTDQCNLRCTYCMPAEIFDQEHAFLQKNKLIQLEELERLIGAFVRCGVRKIRLTGGEPLLRRGVVDFLGSLKRFSEIEDLALTTNGLLLPTFASGLAEAGLHRVTVSLDALDPDIFARMNGRGKHPDQVLKGIESAKSAGLRVKVNMVVQRGVNDSQVLPMALHFKAAGIPLRFIEFMDVGNHNHWDPAMVVSGEEILARLVANRFRYLDDGVEFGIITSISAPFCRSCTRARLSADGRLFTCLFASKGHDLLGAMRAGNPDDETLYQMVASLWRTRDDRYSELRSAVGTNTPAKVEMSFIGG